MRERFDRYDLGHAALPRPWPALRLPLETETARFVLVSALDLMMTCLLIRLPQFTEANPAALYFLSRWGAVGLVWYKCGMVTLVGVLTQAIARRKLETARCLLNFATVVCGTVVLYSLTLWLRHQ